MYPTGGKHTLSKFRHRKNGFFAHDPHLLEVDGTAMHLRLSYLPFLVYLLIDLSAKGGVGANVG